MTDPALWAGVLAAPLDAAPKLVLADWLAERDADPDLEAGLRWAAANGWFPRPTSREVVSNWMAEGYGHLAWNDGSGLRERVHDMLVDSGRLCGCFDRDPAVLVRRLGRALRESPA